MTELTRGRGFSRGSRAIVALAILAALIRIDWVVVGAWTSGDSDEYLSLARHLAAGGIFGYDGVTPSSYRPPLYPGLLAAAMSLTTHPVGAVLGLQVVLGVLTVLLTFSLAARLFSRRTGAIAGFLLALAPMTSRYTAAILTETVFVFLVVLAMWAWNRRLLVPAGVALGLAVLTRAALVPYLIFAVVLTALPVLRRQRRAILTISVVAIVTVAPWIARNLLVTGRATVADAGWGANLLYGTIDLRTGASPWSQLLTNSAGLNLSTEPTAAAERAARDVAIERIQSAPGRWIVIRARQYPRVLIDTGEYLPLEANTRTFRDAITSHQWDTVLIKLGFLGGNILVVLLALLGIAIHRQRLDVLAPLWTFPAFLLAAQLPMYAEPRYGLPLVPFMVIFAAAALDCLPSYWAGLKGLHYTGALRRYSQPYS